MFKLRLLLVLGLPILVTFYLFRPVDIWKLELRPNEPAFISKEAISESFSRTLIADFLQTNLNLGWYDVCLSNKGALSVGGKKLEVVDKENLRGEFSYTIKQKLHSNPDSYRELKLVAYPGETDCLTLRSGIEGISYETGSLHTSFGKFGDLMRYSIPVGQNEFSLGASINFEDLSLFVRNNIWAILVKYIVLVFLCGGLIILGKQIWKFIKLG